ncbi:alpha/beta fold hydrolase [Streptomyces cirratus]|uniref:alpha/beta fold hydrolase n=1 Tax=Streptomyces cirratus TaxID=68187 RepID=UPI0036211586
MDILRRNNVTVSGREGSPVIMLAHGFGCDQNMWRLTVPALAEDHRVVRFDYVGSGRSDLSAWNEERYASLEGYARDVVEICDELDLRDVVFVGHSVSAMIGVLAAADAPSRFSSLVMVGPSPATSTTRTTGAGSAPTTSTSCSTPWSRTTWAGRRRWHRSSWATRTAPDSARNSPPVSAPPTRTSRASSPAPRSSPTAVTTWGRWPSPRWCWSAPRT